MTRESVVLSFAPNSYSRTQAYSMPFERNGPWNDQINLRGSELIYFSSVSGMKTRINIIICSIYQYQHSNCRRCEYIFVIRHGEVALDV